MPWILLTIAGLLEIAFALGMKWSQGFTRPMPGVFTALAGLASIYLLSLALRTLPVGTAYAVWTGIGAVGSVIVGAILFGEPLTAARISYIAIIVIAISGLHIEAVQTPAS